MSERLPSPALPLLSTPLSGVLRDRTKPRLARPIPLLIGSLLILAAVRAWLVALATLQAPDVYNKDLIQDYVLARAVVSGTNPYLPLPLLVDTFLGDVHQSLVQPSPHPPFAAILVTPLALLTYEQAAIAWFVFEISCIAVAMRLLTGRLPRALMLSFLAIAWAPFQLELDKGQLMTLLLVLLAGTWAALRAGRLVLAGSLLGVALAVKLIGWPILLFLVLTRKWRAAGSTAAVLAAAHIAGFLLLGTDAMLDYFFRIGPNVAAFYRAESGNISLWSLGWRLFEGTGSNLGFGLAAPPLLPLPQIAAWASLALVGICVSGGLMLALRARTDEAAFAVVVGVSAVASPIAWNNYLILLAIPLVLIVRHLTATVTIRWREIVPAGALAVLLFVPPSLWHVLPLRLAGQPGMVNSSTPIPFAIGLLTLMPLVAIAGLTLLVYHLDVSRNRVAGC